MNSKTEINFNINQWVKVKLNDKGISILERQHIELYHRFEYSKRKSFTPPKVDEDGYSKFQLHDLMNRFGAYCTLGEETPFETDIILIK